MTLRLSADGRLLLSDDGRFLVAPIPALALTDANGDAITEDGTGGVILEDAA